MVGNMPVDVLLLFETLIEIISILFVMHLSSDTILNMYL